MCLYDKRGELMSSGWDGIENRKNNQEVLKKIELQLARLVSHIESEQEKNEYYRADIKRVVERHEHTLFGNGREGLNTRVDRLEQDKKRKESHSLVLYSTAAGLILKTIWDFITNK